MLHLQPAILERIRSQVNGFTTVSNASVMVGLNNIGHLLPACIVQPGDGEPTENSKHQPLLEVQSWDVTIIVAHQACDDDAGKTEQLAGDLMLGVLRALQDWSPDTVPHHQSLRYMGRALPVYSQGYAEFTLTFAAKVFIGLPTP